MNGAMDIMKTNNILGINKVRDFLYKVPETEESLAYNFRALDLLILGPKFCPIPNAKKYVFFPILDKKIPNLTKKFFFLFSIFISYNTNTECIVTISQNNIIQSHMLLSLPFLIVH